MDPEERELHIATCEYEQAQAMAQHSDAVFYEVAAIVWSANVLLLGFMLEVPLKRHTQGPVLCAAILGFFLTLYVPFVLGLTKKGQLLAFSVCQRAEVRYGFKYRLHNRIDRIYPKKRGRWGVCVVTCAFVVVWLYMAARAAASLTSHCEI
jgi:hypothetical protein